LTLSARDSCSEKQRYISPVSITLSFTGRDVALFPATKYSVVSSYVTLHVKEHSVQQYRSRKSQSRCYVATASQSVSLSWCEARPNLGPEIRFLLLSVAGLLMWGAFSDERAALPFGSAVSPLQRSHSRVRVPPQIRDFPNLEGHVPVFISPMNRVAQLYPQALGSLFVASYDSQGCGGGVRTRLHTGVGLAA
jgi:hypothetical protein